MYIFPTTPEVLDFTAISFLGSIAPTASALSTMSMRPTLTLAGPVSPFFFHPALKAIAVRRTTAAAAMNQYHFFLLRFVITGDSEGLNHCAERLYYEIIRQGHSFCYTLRTVKQGKKRPVHSE